MDKRSSSVAPQNQYNQTQISADKQGNNTARKSLHDMEAFRLKKITESAPFFRSTRVQSCSHVVVKNGHAVAVAFPLEKTGWKNPNSYVNTVRSQEIQSWARVTFKQRGNLHAGMLKKPLEPYHPLAHRSRLPQPIVVMPYKNSSQIVIGDRSSDDKRQFKTTNQLMQIAPDHSNVVTNGGILAAQTKWTHYHQNKQ